MLSDRDSNQGLPECEPRELTFRFGSLFFLCICHNCLEFKSLISVRFFCIDVGFLFCRHLQNGSVTHSGSYSVFWVFVCGRKDGRSVTLAARPPSSIDVKL
jgi:hypothetical protein